MFPVAEQTGAIAIGNTQIRSIIIYHVPDFPNKVPRLRSTTYYII
jgi:hypothetical protein